MKLVSVAAMRKLEAGAMRAGVSGEEMMRRAGIGAAELAAEFVGRRFAPEHRRRWAVLAGKGNNAGDAYVVAAHLAKISPLPVAVFATTPPGELSGAARFHAERMPSRIPVQVVAELPPEALQPGTILVDGLLGTGLSGAPRAPFGRITAQVNASGLPVVALDLPSGMDADSGGGGCVVTADLTVTMGLPKKGLFSETGRPRCGCIRCVEIGLAAKAVAGAASSGDALFAEDVRPFFPRRPAEAHKNRFGHLLVAAGSADYTGAPMLAAEAGLRTGCGLVTVAVPEAARPLMHAPLAALIVRSIPDGGRGFFGAESAAPLRKLLEKAQAVVFGPGAGAHAGLDRPLKAVLDAGIPAVIDADGLRRLARHPEWLAAKGKRKNGRTEEFVQDPHSRENGKSEEFVQDPHSRENGETERIVLTPHPGEMRVLLEGFGLGDRLDAPRAAQAEALACHTGACVVLKGMGTIVAAPGGRVTVNSAGGSALATAGSGDVLAGMIGGLLAQDLPAWDAARAAVFLHGLAAELAPSERALVADDLPDLTKAALRVITSAA